MQCWFLFPNIVAWKREKEKEKNWWYIRLANLSRIIVYCWGWQILTKSLSENEWCYFVLLPSIFFFFKRSFLPKQLQYLVIKQFLGKQPLSSYFHFLVTAMMLYWFKRITFKHDYLHFGHHFAHFIFFYLNCQNFVWFKL